MNTPAHRGYSLVELIVVLLLSAVVGVCTSLLLVPVAEGFLDAQTNAEHVEKTQLVMMRLEKELGSITEVRFGTAHQLRYRWLDPGGIERESELYWQGRGRSDPLYLNNAVLLADFEHLEFAYYTRDGTRTAQFERPQEPLGNDTVSIAVTLDFGAAGSAFHNQFQLRNLPLRRVP